MWQCSTCTFENKVEDNRCELCRAFRDQASLEAAAAASAARAVLAPSSRCTWVCKVCTFVNNDADTSCQACDTLNPSVASRVVSSTNSSSAKPSAAAAFSSSLSSSSSSSSSSLYHVDDSTPRLSRAHYMGLLTASASATSSATAASRTSPGGSTSDDIFVATPGPRYTMSEEPWDVVTIASFLEWYEPLARLHWTKVQPLLPRTSEAEVPRDFSSSERVRSKKKPRLSNKKATAAHVTTSSSSSISAAFAKTPLPTMELPRLRLILGRLYQQLQVQVPMLTEESTGNVDQCQVCFADFSPTSLSSVSCKSSTMADDVDDDLATVQCLTNCGHRDICQVCITMHMQSRIKDETVLPWIPCPAPRCGVPIHPSDWYNIDRDELIAFLCVYTRKHLVRHERFIICKTNLCPFGFLRPNDDVVHVTCPVCQLQQRAKANELDDEFQKMLADGTMKHCPLCRTLTMKEKGVCNAITCGKCNGFWNWMTLETASSAQALKDKARRDGKLWIPSDFAYQQELERTNPTEFQSLLERNGIMYDKNYVRGTR